LMLKEQGAWYSDVGKEQFGQGDTEKARELMQEAGYIGGDIRILAPRDNEDLHSLAIAAQQQLRALGMNVFLEVVDWPSFMLLQEQPSAYDIFITSFDHQPTPVHYPFLDSRMEWP